MKFSYGKTFLLGFGFFGVSVIWSVYNAYVPIFLKDRFYLAAGFIGVFMTLDNIAALLIQPPVGAWSDRLRTPIGRRMPFILVGAPLAALAFIFIPLSANLILFFCAAGILLLSMALWRTPVVALMPDITPSPKRSQANGIINLMGGLGAIIAFVGGATLYERDPSYPFYLGAGLVVAAMVLVFIFIKEPKEYREEQEARPNIWKSLISVFQENERSPLLILGAIFCWFISYAGIEAFFTLYGQNHLGLSAADGSRLLGQLSLLFVLFALPSGFIGASFGRRRTILLGISMMAIGILIIYFLPVSVLITPLIVLPFLRTVPVIGLVLMGIGIAWALININSLPMVVDMTDSSKIGTYTGLYYLFSTLAAILGPILYGFIVQLSGNNYNQLMLISPVFLIAAFVLMSGVQRGEASAIPPAR